MGGEGQSVKPSNCFRRLEKLVLPSIFDKSFSSLMMWNLQLSNNSFEWKTVTFLGGQNILLPLPPTYFLEVKTPTSRIYVYAFEIGGTESC